MKDGTNEAVILSNYFNQLRNVELSKVVQNVYSLSWILLLSKSLEIKDKKYIFELKAQLLRILRDEKGLKIAVYDQETCAGLLLGLYHLSSEDKGLKDYSLRVLNLLDRLRWHEYDGEIMSYVLILTKFLGEKEHFRTIRSAILEKFDYWVKNPDPDNLRQISYTLFGLSYILDKGVVELVEKYKLYAPGSYRIEYLIQSYDVESLSLFLYSLGRIVYTKLRKQAQEYEKDIRLKLIPLINRVLDRRIKELGLVGDLIVENPHLWAKIHLAKIETGMSKPFQISKYEWEIYQEVLKYFEEGFIKAKRSHIIASIVASTTLTSLLLISLIYEHLLDEWTKGYLTLDRFSNLRLIDILRLLDLNLIIGILKSIYEYGRLIPSVCMKGVLDSILGWIRKALRGE